MMIEDRVIAALAGLFSGGVWNQIAGDNAVAPYAVINCSQDTRTNQDGKAPLQNFHAQVDVYAATGSEASGLADLVEARLDAQNMDASPNMFTAMEIGRDSGPPDPETMLKRVMLQYSLWVRVF